MLVVGEQPARGATAWETRVPWRGWWPGGGATKRPEDRERRPERHSRPTPTAIASSRNAEESCAS